MNLPAVQLVAANRRLGFTLVEILAVTVLLTCAVALATVRLYAVSEKARIETAAEQVHVAVAQAQILAQADGLPQVLSWRIGAAQGAVRELRIDQHALVWSPPKPLRWPKGVVLTDCAPRSDETTEQCAVRVNGDGRADPRALVLRAGELQAAVIIDGRGGPVRLRWEGPFDAQAALEAFADSSACAK